MLRRLTAWPSLSKTLLFETRHPSFQQLMMVGHQHRRYGANWLTLKKKTAIHAKMKTTGKDAHGPSNLITGFLLQYPTTSGLWSTEFLTVHHVCKRSIAL